MSMKILKQAENLIFTLNLKALETSNSSRSINIVFLLIIWYVQVVKQCLKAVVNPQKLLYKLS